MKTIIIAASLLIAVECSTTAQTTKTDTTTDKNKSSATDIDLGQFLSVLGSFRGENVSTNNLKTNDVFKIQLQKDKANRGISINSFVGTVTTSEEAFSSTTGKVAVSDLVYLVANSATNGHKPQTQFSVTSKFTKDKGLGASAPQFCLFGIYVSASASTNAIPTEIKKRFDLSPPYELDLWLDGESVFVDLANEPVTKNPPEDTKRKK